jgi:hypothetical protein
MLGSSPVEAIGSDPSPPPPPDIPPDVSVEEEEAFGSPNEGWLLSVWPLPAAGTAAAGAGAGGGITDISGGGTDINGGGRDIFGVESVESCETRLLSSGRHTAEVDRYTGTPAPMPEE